MTVSSSFWYFCEFSELTVNKIPLSSPTKLEKGMQLLEQICRLFFRHELKYKTCYLNIRNFFLLWGWSNTRDWNRKTLEILKVWLEMILGSLLLDPTGSTSLTGEPQRYIPRLVALYFCESPTLQLYFRCVHFYRRVWAFSSGWKLLKLLTFPYNDFFWALASTIMPMLLIV